MSALRRVHGHGAPGCGATPVASQDERDGHARSAGRHGRPARGGSTAAEPPPRPEPRLGRPL